MPRILGRIVDFVTERRLGQRAVEVVRDVFVGRTPTPGGPTPISLDHPLARYNKLIAVPVGALLGWLATKTGWTFLVEYQTDVTLAIVGYLVWRFPNAPAR